MLESSKDFFVFIAQRQQFPVFPTHIHTHKQVFFMQKKRHLSNYVLDFMLKNESNLNLKAPKKHKKLLFFLVFSCQQNAFFQFLNFFFMLFMLFFMQVQTRNYQKNMKISVLFCLLLELLKMNFHLPLFCPQNVVFPGKL